MILTKYEELLGHVSPLVAKSNQRRESIGSNQQSCVILRYIQPRSRIFQNSNFFAFLFMMEICPEDEFEIPCDRGLSDFLQIFYTVY